MPRHRESSTMQEHQRPAAAPLGRKSRRGHCRQAKTTHCRDTTDTRPRQGSQSSRAIDAGPSHAKAQVRGLRQGLCGTQETDARRWSRHSPPGPANPGHQSQCSAMQGPNSEPRPRSHSMPCSLIDWEQTPEGALEPTPGRRQAQEQ